MTNEVRIVGTSTNTTVFTYDANGSLTNSAPSTGSAIAYSYDLENRLATATVNRLEGTNTVNVVAGYVYNPFGIRVRSDTTTTVNGGSPVAKKKAFVIDAHNGTGYAQVLEEKDGTGALTMSYTIGDDVIAQSSNYQSQITNHHFGYDGHGSTRILTDDSAAIESGTRYDYDAYGVTVRGPSSILDPPSSSLLYTGEQFDVDLQQCYLRARYYDQSRGRFTQMDSFAGENHDPQSLHKYAYAHCDAINNMDPTGLLTLAEKVAVTAVITVVAALLFTALAGNSIRDHISEKGLVPDALFLTVGGNVGTGGALLEGSGTLIYDMKTGSVWALGTPSAGVSPITFFKKHKVGRSIVFGAMFSMSHPSDFSGLGFTATWPLIAFSRWSRTQKFFKSVLPKHAYYWYVWLANKNTKPGSIADSVNQHYSKLGVIQFGYSATSGASFVGFGLRDNTFSAAIGWSTPTLELVDGLPQKIMNFFKGAHTDLDSMFHAADAADFTE